MNASSRNLPATKAATWIALAPHEAAYGAWHFVKVAGSEATASIQGTLPGVAHALSNGTNGSNGALGASVILVAPLTRCIVMAIDLPPLQGAKLQHALTGVLGDRLIDASESQHFAVAPIEDGRMREAVACDGAWLKQCVEAMRVAGLHLAQVVPEASLLPKGAAWWGRLHQELSPAWLVRSANGEAIRVAPPLLDAVLSTEEEAAHKSWQWFADGACEAPIARGVSAYTAMSAITLLRSAAKTTWDLQQFSFAVPDRAARIMSGCAQILHRRSGRFVLGATLALLLVNLLGLNLYALKQKREINMRHDEMERIVTRALPGAPRLLEPAVQLEAAWQRTRGAVNRSDASVLLRVFAQAGSGQALTALDISEQALRANFSDISALERHHTACQVATTSEPLLRAGVRCRRDGEQLLLDFTPASAGLPEFKG